MDVTKHHLSNGSRVQPMPRGPGVVEGRGSSGDAGHGGGSECSGWAQHLPVDCMHAQSCERKNGHAQVQALELWHVQLPLLGAPLHAIQNHKYRLHNLLNATDFKSRRGELKQGTILNRAPTDPFARNLGALSRSVLHKDGRQFNIMYSRHLEHPSSPGCSKVATAQQAMQGGKYRVMRAQRSLEYKFRRLHK